MSAPDELKVENPQTGENPTPCECAAPGFCRRHNRHMPPQWWEQCRSDPAWYEVFANSAPPKSRGLGDTVAKVTRATGIDRVVKSIAGDDCGCNERQEWLNKVFPYSTVETPLDVSQVEFLIKSFRRFGCLWRCVHSIKHWWPEATIRIADDSLQEDEAYPPIVETIRNRPGVHWYRFPFDAGLPFGRNRLAELCEAPYLFNVDDDFVFTAETPPGRLIALLEAGVCDVACGVQRISDGRVQNWGGRVEPNSTGLSILAPDFAPLEVAGVRYRPVDVGLNYFAARAQTIRDNPWDEQFKTIYEHLDHFLTFRARGFRVASTSEAVIAHLRPPKSDTDYTAFRYRRGGEGSGMRKRLLEKWNLSALPDSRWRSVEDVPQVKTCGLLAPLKDRPNVVLLTVGRSGSSILAQLLHGLGWCPGDADREYSESVAMRKIDNAVIYEKQPFDDQAADALMADLPQPWCVKHPGMFHTWRSWLPHFARSQPTLLWLTRDSDAVSDSLIRQRLTRGHRAVAQLAGGVSVQEGLRLCGECYDAWPWGKLKFSIEQIAGVLGEFDPARVLHSVRKVEC